MPVGGVVSLPGEGVRAWLTPAGALLLIVPTTAGLAFALIVWQAGEHGIPITVPWSDVMLHFVLPAWTIVAWVFGPGRRSASWRVVPFVLLYPVVWGVFTIWRGSVIGWYPYYFLDLRQVSGLGEMALSCALALAIFAGVAVALVLLSKVRPTVPPWGEISPRPLPALRRTRARRGRRLPHRAR